MLKLEQEIGAKTLKFELERSINIQSGSLGVHWHLDSLLACDFSFLSWNQLLHVVKFNILFLAKLHLFLH